jgi:hypothetical protein
VVKGVKIAGGMLKAGGKGAPLAVPNGAASIHVVLSLDGGTNTYCMTFSGTGDGNKFLVKDAAAGTCPGSGADTPTPTPPAATPTDTPSGACDASGYPTCGGSCGSGYVCQPIDVFTGCSFCLPGLCPCSDTTCYSDISSCMCVPAAGTCGGSVDYSQCFLAQTPFTYGPCSSGETCADLDLFGGPFIRGCQHVSGPTTPTPTPTPATSCPSGGQLVGGFCWYLGVVNDSCDGTCAAVGMTCDQATDTYAGADGTLAHCQALENAMGASDMVYDENTGAFAAMGCAQSLPVGSAVREVAYRTSCSAVESGYRRFCACHP